MNSVIFFAERYEKPHGVFSNFYHSPILIAEKIYPTVEHWYQAGKSTTLELHDAIRCCSEPEDAKKMGRSLPIGDSWKGERIGVMYRGLLAKFRQHSELAAILLKTGDATIHERTSDPVWGWNEGEGQDLLGRLLMTIRDQLRHGFDSIPDTVIRAYLQGSSYSAYQIAASIRMGWEKESAWLSYFLPNIPGPPLNSKLADILTQGQIQPSVQCTGHRAISFTSAPLSLIKKSVFSQETRPFKNQACPPYSGYGIALPFDFGRELGIAPVLPMPPETATEIPESLRYRVEFYSPRDQLDRTYELEWRYANTMNLPTSLAHVIVPTYQEKDAVANTIDMDFRFIVLSD